MSTSMRCVLLSALCASATGFNVAPATLRTTAFPRRSLLMRAADDDAATFDDEEPEDKPVPAPAPAPVAAAPAPVAVSGAPDGWMELEETMWGPEKQATMRIEGGQTLKTFQMPAHAERVQYVLKGPSNRPVKAKVELWIGPERCVHEMMYDCMDGAAYPLRVNLKFKKVQPVLKISTDGPYEFPLQFGVFVPSPEESAHIAETTESMFYNAPVKQKVQGGSIRNFVIGDSWEKTQIMVWSTDVGKKSFKSNIEVLQGPNNQKQFINLRCGGSTQPFHAVIDTPGPGWTVRLNSKKNLEDGLFEVACAPYGLENQEDPQDQVVVGGGGFY